MRRMYSIGLDVHKSKIRAASSLLEPSRGRRRYLINQNLAVTDKPIGMLERAYLRIRGEPTVKKHLTILKTAMLVLALGIPVSSTRAGCIDQPWKT